MPTVRGSPEEIARWLAENGVVDPGPAKLADLAQPVLTAPTPSPVAPKAKKAAKAKGRHIRGVMNSLEAKYAAEVLEPQKIAGEILWYAFEAITLRLAPRTTYTPDFLVMMADCSLRFVETKGWMRDDAAVKIKVAASMFPVPFYLVKRKNGKWTEKEVATS